MSSEHKRRKARLSKAERTFDEELYTQVNKIRSLVTEHVEAEVPKCPNCGGNELYVHTVKNPIAGEKPGYVCRNKVCGRHFVSDNDAYKNVFLKGLAWQMIAMGGPSAASKALKLLQQYGAGIETAPVTRYLITTRRSAP